tara:strand:- start:1308 stop:1454 length:147 start_codon:yes stop_codon:yes gene_type:complete
MKQFILINGKDVFLKRFVHSAAARTYVINHFDHSKTVAFYEFENINLI